MNDRYFNFVVACLYCALATFSPLAFSNDVRVGVSPTTGYYEVTSKTFDVPKGASVSSSTAVSPTVTPLAGGGFQQSMGGGITIEGLKKPAPFTARAAAGLQTMRNGAKNLFRSNPAIFVASVGGGLLFNSLDWIMGEGSQVNKVSKTWLRADPSLVASTQFAYSWRKHELEGRDLSNLTNVGSSGDHFYYCLSKNLIGFTGVYCQHGLPGTPPSVEYTSIPVQSSDINSAIDSDFNPSESDFVLLTPYMSPDFILVDPIPPVQTDLGITNTYDSTGALTGTEQKTSTTKFTVSNNSTSQPSISTSTSVKTETFKDGQSQGSTVTETTQPSTGGGSKVEIPTVEIPTDCDFHPTLCKWLDWTKEEPAEPDLDLKPLLQTTNIEMKSFVFSASDAGCPAPIALDLSFLGSREVSYQPLCDLASTMKPLYLALMAFLSALLISRSINRV